MLVCDGIIFNLSKLLLITEYPICYFIEMKRSTMLTLTCKFNQELEAKIEEIRMNESSTGILCADCPNHEVIEKFDDYKPLLYLLMLN